MLRFARQHADQADGHGVAEAVGDLAGARGDGDGEVFPGPLHSHFHRLAGIEENGFLHLPEIAHRFAVDGRDPVTHKDARFARGRIFGEGDNVVLLRWISGHWLAVCHEECCKNADGDQQVGDRPGGYNQRLLPQFRVLECARLVRSVRIGHAGRVHVALKLHISAQRQQRELPPCAALIRIARQFLAEPDRERHCLNAEKPANEVVAQFVQGNERPEHQQEADDHHPQGYGFEQFRLSPAFARLWPSPRHPHSALLRA